LSLYRARIFTFPQVSAAEILWKTFSGLISLSSPQEMRDQARAIQRKGEDDFLLAQRLIRFFTYSQALLLLLKNISDLFFNVVSKA
jgi:hypothetical protein